MNVLSIIQWDDRATVDLLPAMGDYDGLVWLKNEWASQRVTVMRGTVAGVEVGTVAVRIDDDELVLIAAGGGGPGIDLYRWFTPMLEDIARSLKIQWVRAHSSRPGIWRKLERQGFAEAERVFRKAVV